jgi:hypothetical protein
LLGAYEDALRLPARAAVRADGALDARYWALRHQIGGTGLSLVGPEDPLLPPNAQRALAALVRRPLTRGLVMAGLRAAGFVGRLGASERSHVAELPAGEPRAGTE